MKIFKALALYFGLSFSLSTSFADIETSDTGEIWNISFSIFPLERANWDEMLYAPNGNPEDGTEELFFNRHEKSGPYPYQGSNPLRFFRKRQDEEGRVIYQSVAELSLKKNRVKLILFCDPDNKGQPDGPYTIRQMTDTPQSYPNESLVFFNSTGATFYGVLGGEKIVLEPGASEPIDVSPFFEDPAPIGLVVNDGKKLRKVLVNTLQFSPNRRTLIILKDPKSSSSFRVRTQRLTEFTGERALPKDSGA